MSPQTGPGPGAEVKLGGWCGCVGRTCSSPEAATDRVLARPAPEDGEGARCRRRLPVAGPPRFVRPFAALLRPDTYRQLSVSPASSCSLLPEWRGNVCLGRVRLLPQADGAGMVTQAPPPREPLRFPGCARPQFLQEKGRGQEAGTPAEQG